MLKSIHSGAPHFNVFGDLFLLKESEREKEKVRMKEQKLFKAVFIYICHKCHICI